MPKDDALARLAKQIDAARKSEPALITAAEVAALRLRGAQELHQVCAEFVASLNSRLTESALDLAPPAFTPQMFREPAENLFQITSQGRTMQIMFKSAGELFSTDKFPVPYVLEGEIRTYNQKMLERFEIRSQMLFYCLNEDTATWRFYDWRDRHTAPVDRNLLASLMERLF